MRTRWNRVLLVLIGLPNLLTGAWALIDARGWFDNFPGWSPRLVAAYPPFNEHLAADAGAGLLTVGVLSLTAAALMRRDVTVTAMVGALAFIVPHTLFHAFNPAPDDALTTAENIQSTGLLAVSLAAAVWVLVTTLQA